jgi:adenylate cyclase
MPTILVVDDIANNRRLLRSHLTARGYVIHEADCLQGAVAMAGEQQYDLVLMDINIPRDPNSSPGYDVGIEACRQILNLAFQPPIVAVTAAGMDEEKSAILEAGVLEIVQKAESGFLNRVCSVVSKYVGTSEKSTATQPIGAVGNSSTESSGDVATSTDSTSRPGVDEFRQAWKTSSREPDLGKPNGRMPTSDQITGSAESIEGIEETQEFLALAYEASLDLAKRMRQLKIDESYVKNAEDLIGEITLVAENLAGGGDGPTAGETLDHWVCNLLMSAQCTIDELREAHRLADHPPIVGAIAQVQGKLNAVVNHARDLNKPPAEISSHSTHRLDSKHYANEPVRRIMIVDDQHAARRDLEAKLKRLNYRVVSCENALTALELLEEQQFDVCLLDLHMPGISGLEMIQRIRQSHAARNTSIIVVSGSGQMQDAARAIEQGADDYLPKPADENLLRARIKSCLRQSDARLAELSKFLPSHIIQRVMSNQDLLDKPAPADVTVIVCDIRGFSRISEKIGPVQTINWISDVMNELSQIILEHGGAIIDYVGDEIMAMWGAPIATPRHASEACECALAIQNATDQLSIKWRQIINSDMKIGIGINSGLAVVGNTGSKHRIKYGPLGDTVNVASRVQGATKYLQSPILITHSTASRIDKCMRGRRVCSVRVQNISEPQELFELSRCDTDLANERRRVYEDALQAFESEDLSEACAMLARLLCEFPQDGPTKLLMLRVLQTQLGQRFDPFWTLPGK